MLSSVFRYPMPLLLWNWSACRKNLLLYETLQHLWKQFNLVYTQCNISPGVIQNSPQTRLSSSLGVGLSLAIWDCSIHCCQDFTSSYLHFLEYILYECYWNQFLLHADVLATAIKVFLLWVEYSKKMIGVIHSIYLYFDPASYTCISWFHPYGVSPPKYTPQ